MLKLDKNREIQSPIMEPVEPMTLFKELIHFIESVKPFQVAEVGAKKWFEVHEMVVKLSQQATLEATEHREEEVKELLITRDKLKVLIQEAFCINIWKIRVLPHILEIDPNPQATFLIYSVLFHEATVIALLDTTLYHVSCCEVLQDSSLDLVDYCAQAVAQLIGLVSMGHHENEQGVDVDESTLSELDRQKRDILFKIGLRCISILNYLADNHAALPLSATRRMVVTHDIPWLMSDVLHFRPWQRRTKRGLQKFIDEQWTDIEGDELAKVTKIEAQTWFCMRQLLFNQNIMQNYELNTDRRKHLAKCQGFLNDTVLDQLPPLAELKHFLCQIGCGGNQGGTFGTAQKSKTNLLLEEVPEMKENLMKAAEIAGGFVAIAQQQEPIFLVNDKEKIMELATRMNKAYNTDLITEFMDKADEANMQTVETSTLLEQNMGDGDKAVQKCVICSSAAEKKCANCKLVYYCSRKCQVADWNKHKEQCVKI